MGWARKLSIDGDTYPNPKPFRVLPHSDEMSHWSHREATSSPSTLPICKNVLLLITSFFSILVTRGCFHFLLLVVVSYPSMMPCCHRIVELCLYFPTLRVSFWLIFCQCALCIKGVANNLITKSQLVLEFVIGSFSQAPTSKGNISSAKPNVLFLVVMELKPWGTFVLHYNV